MRSSAAQNGTPSKLRKILITAACVAVAITVAGLFLLHHYWPFSEAAVRKELGDAASASVTFSSFHDKYFPPGCAAEGVVFRRDGSGTPLITIRRLVITSNLFGLLHHHVSLIRAEGALVHWQRASNAGDPPGRPTIIDRLVADDGVLEIPRASKQPLRFAFRKFEVKNLRGPGQSTFKAEFDNPLPHGALQVAGHFGPWNSSHPSKTALDGNYSLDKADMSVFHSVGGLISSTGHFSGVFDHLDVQAQASMPGLEVTKTHHSLPLKADFSVLVDGPSGDVFVRRMKAQFGKDDLDVNGSIARDQDGKRVASLDFVCNNGRIEDTFYPFIHSPQAALAGNVKFRMHVRIPGGKEKFEKRLALESTFQIADAHFTHPQTETELSKISERPKQSQPDTTIPASFQGNVSVKNGVAQFTTLDVEDQGASAIFRGSYDLTDEKVNMHGQLKTEASLTKATHGIKSVFAKVVEPFFKKKPHETVVPVKIGGTYSHPQFGLDMGQKKM
jgi:AsmA-like C-terminal region